MSSSVIGVTEGTVRVGAGLTVTVTRTFAAGNSGHLFGVVDTSFTVASVTSVPAATWTALGNIDDGINENVYHYAAKNLSGSTVITVTFNTSSADFAACAVAEIGQTNGYDSVAGAKSINNQQTPGTGTNGLTSGNLPILTSQPALLVGWSVNIGSGVGAPNVSSGFTDNGAFFNFGSGTSMRCESKRLTSTAATAATLTATVNRAHTTAAAAFLEAAAVANSGFLVMF